MISVSSAYWQTLCSTLFIVIPFIDWLMHILLAKISATRINRKDGRGYPCVRPLVKQKGSEVQPLFITFEKLSLYRVHTQDKKLVPKLKKSKVQSMYGHPIESKAFWKSIFTIMASIWWESKYSMMLNNLFIFSPTNLPLIKPVWSVLINISIFS